MSENVFETSMSYDLCGLSALSAHVGLNTDSTNQIRGSLHAVRLCCLLQRHKTQHHKTPVPNRAAGAYWGRHGLHQQGHEGGREEPDGHGSVLWSVYLANQEVGLVSVQDPCLHTTSGLRNPVPLHKYGVYWVWFNNRENIQGIKPTVHRYPKRLVVYEASVSQTA